jgi:hypothetical protein
VLIRPAVSNKVLIRSAVSNKVLIFSRCIRQGVYLSISIIPIVLIFLISSVKCSFV